MSQPRKKRRWALVLVLVLLVLIPGSLLGVGAALTYRPAWYQPPSIDYNFLEEDKRIQLRLENEISAAVNRDEPATIELDQAQANRWIAAREELWPGEVPSLGPLRQPQLDLLGENRFRVGALVEQAGVEAVVSAAFRVEVRPETVTITCDQVNTGALRTPRTSSDETSSTAVAPYSRSGSSRSRLISRPITVAPRAPATCTA